MPIWLEVLIGIGAYVFVGALTVALDAFVEYRQGDIAGFDGYNRRLAILITLFWPVAWFWGLVAGTPRVIFWVLKKCNGNPFSDIKEAVGARRRQKDNGKTYLLDPEVLIGATPAVNEPAQVERAFDFPVEDTGWSPVGTHR